jgi:hypothetical protein
MHPRWVRENTRKLVSSAKPMVNWSFNDFNNSNTGAINKMNQMGDRGPRELAWMKWGKYSVEEEVADTVR